MASFDDFHFADTYPEEQYHVEHGTVPDGSAVGGRVLTAAEEERLHREAESDQRAYAIKRSGFAKRKAEARVPYSLSLANTADDGDAIDMLDQTILVVPHADIMKALDLIRVTRDEIKGLKKAKVIEAADMVDTYANNLYAMSRAIDTVDGMPTDDPFWRHLEKFHSLVDSFIEKGAGRGELERALHALPENVQVVYYRDNPVRRDDFDLHEHGSKRVVTNDMIDSISNSISRDDRRSQVAQPADGTTADTALAPKIKHIVKSMTKTHKTAPSDKKEEMLSHKMPDGVTGVYQHLVDLVDSHASDAAPIARAPQPKVARPRAPRAAPKSDNSKRPRDEDDDFVF